jgi:peptidoglycan/xylan/chitin deacetylase (PgdA/CDA1 family)
VDTLRYALQMNMTLASHTAGHPHMPQLTDDQVRFQIKETNKYLRRVVNVSPKYIRLPYGETDDRIERIIREEFNMLPIYWSIDTADSLGATQDQEVAVFNPLRRNSQDIIIMHDTNEKFANETFEMILKCEW